MKPFWILLLALSSGAQAKETSLKLMAGYVYKVECNGRLLVSAVGNESLLQTEPLPREIGCGILIKAKASAGSTNLVLETTSGSVQALIEIRPTQGGMRSQDLRIRLDGERGL